MKDYQVSAIEVTLENYWHESISLDEAARRLASRTHLTPDSIEQAREIFAQPIDHYIYFGSRTFKEYVTFRDGITHLMLLLRSQWSDTHRVQLVVPFFDDVDGELGGRRRAYGVAFPEFDLSGSHPRIDGHEIGHFAKGTEPRRLKIDSAMLHPRGDERHMRMPVECCVACEVVHSVLGFHWADGLCCLGCC